jgi:DNA-binding NtrC family response regulator
VDLRVLFVEDSTDDVALMLRRLREAGIEPHWDRVQTEAALREALAGERWELALVDYNLPGFGGPQALAVLAEVAPDLPAITVSGAISEDTAVATIKAGAVDYVLKDNLTRLAPAVQRAVEGAELRRKQRRSAGQARQTMYAIEHSSQAIVYVSEGGVVLYANEAAQRFGGGSPVDAVGQELWDWVPMLN